MRSWGVRSPLIKYTHLPLPQHVCPAPFLRHVHPCAGIAGPGPQAALSTWLWHTSLSFSFLPSEVSDEDVREVMEGGSLEMQIRGPRLRAGGSQGITWSTTSHAGWCCGVSDNLEHQTPSCPSVGSQTVVWEGEAQPQADTGVWAASPLPHPAPHQAQSILCPQHCHPPGPLPGTVSSPPAGWAGRLPMAVTSLGTLSLGTHI